MPSAFDDLEQLSKVSDASAVTMMPDLDASTGGPPREVDTGVASESHEGGAEGTRPPPASDGEVPMPPEMSAGCGDCSAAHASATCVAATCSRTCSGDYADCNGDLARGSAGDGCETSLADSPLHCGDCATPCSAPPGGLASCRARSCLTTTVAVGAATKGLRRGGGGGAPFPDQRCEPGSVLTGIDGYVSTLIGTSYTVTDSMRIRCSRLTLQEGVSGPSLQLSEGSFPGTLLGGEDIARLATARMPYQLYCAGDEAISAVRVTAWSYWGDDDGVAYPSVAALAIRCAKVSVEGGRIVVDAAGRLLAAPTALTGRATTVTLDPCQRDGAIVGFAGSAGLHIDGLAPYCSTLSLAQAASTPAR